MTTWLAVGGKVRPFDPGAWMDPPLRGEIEELQVGYEDDGSVRVRVRVQWEGFKRLDNLSPGQIEPWGN